MVIVFDVNGTLLDIHDLAPHIRRIFGRKLTVEAWFTEVVQYSMALTLTNEYQEFGDIAIAVLQMAAAGHGIELSTADIEKVREGMKQLPPFPDVNKGLRRLEKAGFRLAALSNSAAPALESQLDDAGLRRYFEQALSADSGRRYKPSAEIYRGAAGALGVGVEEILMVSAHSWDLLGAARVGCQTAFIARPGKALLPTMTRPDYVANDLEHLADQVLEGTEHAKSRHGVAAALITAGIGLGVAAAVAPMIRESRRPRAAVPPTDIPCAPSPAFSEERL